MSWFRLDDRGAFHEKVLAAGNEAYGAWCRAGQWSSLHLTEGRIPKLTALTIAKAKVWRQLVTSRLCEELGDDGWQIHDFLDWNPSAAEVQAKRTARAEAGRRGGVSKAAATSKQPASNALAIANHVAKQNSAPIPIPIPIPERSDPPIPPEGGLVLVPSSASEVRRIDVVERIFDRYLEVRSRHRPDSRAPRLKPKERARAAKLLAAEYSPDDLELACEGLFMSPHHLGKNDRDTEYLEFFHALGENVVDGFIEVGGRERARSNPAPATPPTETEEYAPPTPEEKAHLSGRIRAMFDGHAAPSGAPARIGGDLSPEEVAKLEAKRVATVHALRADMARETADVTARGAR